MTRRQWLALAASVPAFAQKTKPDEVTFRAEVRLVRLLVTVRDPSGQLVGGLDKSDFTIQDSGVPQTVSIFERQTELPLSIALMIDISGSTAKDLKYEVQ